MYLSSLTLSNWRSHKFTKFDFSLPVGQKNVILINGANECGKTSLFEALVLGLYGVDGLRLVPRARRTPGDDASKLHLYSKFMEGTLHREVDIENRSDYCGISLEFVTDTGPTTIDRKWHFSDNGKHQPNDDEVRIYEDRNIISPPAHEIGIDEDAWYRDYIARTFLPVDLANFFLFDGEQAQYYASLDMSEQVKKGIMGLLGLTTLENLEMALIDYAQSRRKTIQTPAEGEVSKLVDTSEELSKEREEKVKERDQINAEIEELRIDETDLLRELDENRNSDMSRIKDLIQKEETFKQKAFEKTQEISDFLASEVAMALAGQELIEKTIEQLKAEEEREDWEEGRRQGDAKFSAYHEDLTARLKPIGINEKKRQQILEIVKTSWQKIWDPLPDGASEYFMHGSLSGDIRRQSRDKLSEISQGDFQKLETLIDEREKAAEEIRRIRRERINEETKSPERYARVMENLRKVQDRVGKLKGEVAVIENHILTIDSKLAAAKATLEKLLQHEGSEANKQAKFTDKIASLIKDIRGAAIPSQTSDIGEAMTKAWKSMSHMSDRVQKIEVSPECEVMMLSKNGEDLRKIDKSAGGEQVFTQALFWAVVHVSKFNFPFVVDTPLARLSQENRLGVIKQFVEHDGQVFLLSTDTEVVGEVKEAIRDKISEEWNLSLHDYGKGIGHTSVEKSNKEA